MEILWCLIPDNGSKKQTKWIIGIKKYRYAFSTDPNPHFWRKSGFGLQVRIQIRMVCCCFFKFFSYKNEEKYQGCAGQSLCWKCKSGSVLKLWIRCRTGGADLDSCSRSVIRQIFGSKYRYRYLFVLFVKGSWSAVHYLTVLMQIRIRHFIADPDEHKLNYKMKEK